MHWILITFAGFAGSFHCIGMCGGFACGLGVASRTRSRIQNILRHWLYNFGRVVTYGFIGGLAGALGNKIVAVTTSAHSSSGHMTGSHMQHQISNFVLQGELGLFQKGLSVIAGVLMLVMAMQLFGVWRHRAKSWSGVFGESLVSPIRSLVQSPHPGAPVALGVVNGFLPCPLVYAFAVMAAVTGSVVHGMLTMMTFGIGTFPAMLAAGWLGKKASLGNRMLGVRLAGVFVAVFGLMTIVRGLTPAVLHASH